MTSLHTCTGYKGLVAALIMLLLSANIAQAKTADLPDIPYIVVDSDNETVLAENRAFERWHPASLTKLMTAYVTFKAIANGEIEPGSPVTISKAATNTPPSKMGYGEGTRLRVDAALTLLLVKSANDVAVALAESVAGQVPEFVERMNATANELGMRDSHFTNPNGLHQANQYVSARDVVFLSRAIWNEFPKYRGLFNIPSIRTGEKIHYSYNLLLERFDGANGMKTGFVCASGYNMVASAERDNRRLIAVVLGANSQTERAVTAARLLQQGFATSSGTPLTARPHPEKVKGPGNLRAIMCSEKARAERYDPAPETAVIQSSFLNARQITKQPTVVVLGGIDAAPSNAWMARILTPARVPVPMRRPQFVDVDGEKLDSSPSLREIILTPTPRPKTPLSGATQ